MVGQSAAERDPALAGRSAMRAGDGGRRERI
jgi:hypothetical protein